MKILIDMNLSPEWASVFRGRNWDALHWSQVGDARAPDREIMRWAEENGYIVFTHDLDFSALLAATQAIGPSVVQVRSQNILPDHLSELVIDTLRQFETLLHSGAIVVVEEDRQRARVLPLIKTRDKNS